MGAAPGKCELNADSEMARAIRTLAQIYLKGSEQAIEFVLEALKAASVLVASEQKAEENKKK